MLSAKLNLGKLGKIAGKLWLRVNQVTNIIKTEAHHRTQQRTVNVEPITTHTHNPQQLKHTAVYNGRKEETWFVVMK